MNGVDALYQAAILDHHRQPRNFRRLDEALQAEGYNPLCGDRVRVYVRVENGVVGDATFQGFGCAIVMASASMMTGELKGRTVGEACALAGAFRRMLASPVGADVGSLGALACFKGVRRFPARITCATLPWQAFGAALAGGAAMVSTE